MPLIAAKCTNCGGVLEVDSSKDAAICPFCNTPYVVEKAISNYHITNNIHAASVNIHGASADDLFRDAQTFTELGAYKDAAKKYMQMMTAFPADPRGSMGVVRLAIEHSTPLNGGETQLNPLKVALKLGDKGFLNWLYQNFEKNEQVISASVILYPELEDDEFISRLNQYFEKKCQRVRSGKSSLEQEFCIRFGGWDWKNQQLQMNCDCVPCVKDLLAEAKANVEYFNSQIDKIGCQPYRKVAKGVIKRLWTPKWRGSDSSIFSTFACYLFGGIIGNTFYCEEDGSAGSTVRFYDLSKVITQKEIDALFQEIRRCNNEGICPYCGFGRKGFFSNKCNHCGRWL